MVSKLLSLRQLWGAVTHMCFAFSSKTKSLQSFNMIEFLQNLLGSSRGRGRGGRGRGRGRGGRGRGRAPMARPAWSVYLANLSEATLDAPGKQEAIEQCKKARNERVQMRCKLLGTLEAQRKQRALNADCANGLDRLEAAMKGGRSMAAFSDDADVQRCGAIWKGDARADRVMAAIKQSKDAGMAASAISLLSSRSGSRASCLALHGFVALGQSAGNAELVKLAQARLASKRCGTVLAECEATHGKIFGDAANAGRIGQTEAVCIEASKALINANKASELSSRCADAGLIPAGANGVCPAGTAPSSQSQGCCAKVRDFAEVKAELASAVSAYSGGDCAKVTQAWNAVKNHREWKPSMRGALMRELRTDMLKSGLARQFRGRMSFKCSLFQQGMVEHSYGFGQQGGCMRAVGSESADE